MQQDDVAALGVVLAPDRTDGDDLPRLDCGLHADAYLGEPIGLTHRGGATASTHPGHHSHGQYRQQLPHPADPVTTRNTVPPGVHLRYGGLHPWTRTICLKDVLADVGRLQSKPQHTRGGRQAPTLDHSPFTTVEPIHTYNSLIRLTGRSACGIHSAGS